MWEILFRHQDFVAINKPQGISVHRSDGEVSLTATLAAQLGVETVGRRKGMVAAQVGQADRRHIAVCP